jgi:membrane-associated phospholipid phosphatase
MIIRMLSILIPVFFAPGLSAQHVPAESEHGHSVLVPVSRQTIIDTSILPSGTFHFSDTVPLASKASIRVKPVSLRSILIPSGMIAVGAFALASEDLKQLNLSVRRAVWENRAQKHLEIDNYTMAAPTLAVYGLNILGIKGKHNLVDRTAIFGMSVLLGRGIVTSTKHLTGVLRPDSSNRLSFPSGHTAQAFIAAEFMRQEYKDVSPWYGVAAYTMAVSTGFLRMYNNHHWLNDVIAGAGVGILTTRLSYWLYPKLKSKLVRDKRSSTLIMPMYQNGAVGLGMVHQF